MFIDVVLTLITLAVAVIGTLLKEPPRWAKAALIGMAVVASGLSILKAAEEDSAQRFMRMALTSTLTPSNASYLKLGQEVFDDAGYDDVSCYHDADGMTCFLGSAKDKNKHATLVLNKLEVAEMYANEIERSSNRKFLSGTMSIVYDPSYLDDELCDKIGVLGSGIFFSLYHRWPDYNYDGNMGVAIRYDLNGATKEVVLNPDELKTLQKGPSADLFYAIEQKFREKFAKDAALNAEAPAEAVPASASEANPTEANPAPQVK